ncbi:hypothetical protein EON81_03100 [bacterium]|nr:MAG: hypothetical protein EON81_03100 [bacterium]
MLRRVLKGRLAYQIDQIFRAYFIFQAVALFLGTTIGWFFIGTAMPCLQPEDCVGQRQFAQMVLLFMGGTAFLATLAEIFWDD